MCKGDIACEGCKQKLSKRSEEGMSSNIAKVGMAEAIGAAGVYYAGGKYVEQLRVSGDELMKQSAVVGGLQFFEGAIETSIKDASTSAKDFLNNNDYAAPLIIGGIYSLGTTYGLKIDNRPMLMKFLHAAGASIGGMYVGSMAS